MSDEVCGLGIFLRLPEDKVTPFCGWVPYLVTTPLISLVMLRFLYSCDYARYSGMGTVWSLYEGVRVLVCHVPALVLPPLI